MAEIKQKYVLDVEADVTKLENVKKELLSISNAGGNIGKDAEKIVDTIDTIMATLKSTGKTLSTVDANKIIKQATTILNLSQRISEIASKPVKSQEQINEEIEKYTKKLQKAREEYEKLAKQRAKLKEEGTNERDFKANEAKRLLNQKQYQTSRGGKKTTIIDPNKDFQSEWKNYVTNNTDSDKQQTANKRKLEEISQRINEAWKIQAQTIKDVNKAYQDQIRIVSNLELQVEKVQGQTSTPVVEGTTEKMEALNSVMDGLITNMSVATEEANKTGSTQIQVQQSTDNTTKSFDSLGKTLTKTRLGYSLLKRILRESINTIQEMDEAITGMTVVTGMSREEAYSYVSAMQEIAAATSTAMTEVANLTTEYLRQGRTMSESLTLAEETAKAAQISGLTTSETIEYMTAAINGFNLAASDAAHVSDVFSNIAAISATDYETLAIALSKVSAQANLAGMSLEYTTALLAKGMETTQEAPESIGTALKTIIARMRELDDYGSTLEDGASVNSVESALKAAGISLRDVNGEFRDLEDIFNELGPQWDSLNTMQQQAIAQAVAGTRQQSRFVAIMQDWERTAELAAEAQDSAGASAAQYYKYAQGMEAAITNLRNSWQKFIESLSSNKLIINGVNMVTNILESINSVLELGGDFTKTLGTIAIAFFSVKETIGKVVDHFKEWLNTNKQISETLSQIQQQQSSNEDAAEENKNWVDLQNKAYTEQVNKLSELKKQQELNNKALQDNLELQEWINEKKEIQKQLDIEKQAAKNGKYADSSLVFDADESASRISSLESQQKEVDGVIQGFNMGEDPKAIEENINSCKQTATELQTQIDTINNNIGTGLTNSTSLFRHLNEQQQASLQAKLDENNAQIQLNNELLKELEYRKQIASTDEEKKDIDTKIQALTQKNNKLQANNQKALLQATRNLGTQNKLWDSVANKLQRKIGVNVKDLVSKYKTVSKSVTDIFKGNNLHNISIKKTVASQQQLVDTLKKNGAATELIAKEETKLNDLKQLQNVAGEEGLASKNELLALGMTEEQLNNKDLIVEKTKSKEKESQLVTDKLDNAEGVKEVVNTNAATVAEKVNTKEKEKGFKAKLKTAAASMMDSAGQIPMVGWIIAAAIGAAMLGIAISTGVSKSIVTDNERESKIADNQATSYNLKKSISTNSDYATNYEKLLNKKVRTEEEQQEFEELGESIRDLDDDFKGLDGKNLLDALKQKNVQDKIQYDSLIESNYQEALLLKDWDNSSIAQTAIQTKLVNSQEKLIESNYDLIDSNNGSLTSNMKSDAATAAQNLVENYDNSKGMQDQYSAGDFATNIAAMTLGGAAIGTALGGPIGLAVGTALGAVVGTISTIVDNNSIKQANKETAERHAYELEKANEEIVNSVTQFNLDLEKNSKNLSETNKSEFANNLKAYKEMINESNELAKGALEETYTTYSFIDKMLSDQEGNISNTQYETIDKLLDLQLLTEDAIKELANIFTDIESEQQSYKQAYDALNTDNFWKILNDNENTLSKTSTINEIVTYMDKQIKTKDGEKLENADGTYKFKDNGWKAGVHDKEVDKYYKTLVELEAAGLGDLSVGALGQLSSTLGNINIEKFNTAFGKLTSSLDTQSESIRNGDLSKAKALDEATRSSGLLSYFNEVQTEIDQLRTTAETTENAALLQQAQSLQTWLDNKNKEVEDWVLSASGYMSTTDVSDLYTSTQSKIENAKDFIGKSEWSSDDYNTIANIAQSIFDKEGGDYQAIFDALTTDSVKQNEYLEQYIGIVTDSAQQQLEDSAKAAYYWAEKAETESEKAMYLQNAKIAETMQKTIAEGGKLSEADRKEWERVNYESELAALEADSDADSIDSLKKRLTLINKLQPAYEEAYKEEETRLKQVIGNNLQITKTNGQLTINTEDLTEAQLAYWEENKDTLEDYAQQEYEYSQQKEELTENIRDTSIEADNAVYDAYIENLENENDALQEALDKRKEMYEKYFDALEEEEDEEDYETEKARLESAISRLSSSTDSASLQKLKDYQKELQDLEDEHNDTLRSSRREAVLADLDNLGTDSEEALKQAENNKDNIVSALQEWGDEDLLNLLVQANGKGTEEEIKKWREEALATYRNFASSSEVEIPAYANSGVVDYTGLAWVDGTKTKPEAFLNADQTALFSQLANSLAASVQYGGGYNNTLDSSSTVTIGALNLSVNGSVEGGTAQQYGNDLAEAFMEGLRRTGINLNKKA